MRRKSLLTLLLGSLLIVTACNKKKKFTKELWKNSTGISYPMRDKVVDDLLENHKLKGMHYKDVIRLLGRPNDTAALKTSYEVVDTRSEYNPKKEPIFKKNLEFYFSKDSVVTRTAIFERTVKY